MQVQVSLLTDQRTDFSSSGYGPSNGVEAMGPVTFTVSLPHLTLSILSYKVLYGLFKA